MRARVGGIGTAAWHDSQSVSRRSHNAASFTVDYGRDGARVVSSGAREDSPWRHADAGGEPTECNMIDPGYDFISPEQLRIGLYVELELGWLSHPFPKGSFKISSARQIETIQGLGLKRVRYLPARSDPASVLAPDPDTTPGPQAFAAAPDGADAPGKPDPETDMQSHADGTEQSMRRARAALLATQRESLAHCDQQFDAAIQHYRRMVEQIPTQPVASANECRAMVDMLVGDMLGQSESSIRLLSESTGDRAWMHPVNVTVLSLLLGKAMSMSARELRDLGIAAFLHDIGKTQLPDRVRLADTNFSPPEYRMYQSHVVHSIVLATRMQLPVNVQTTIGQHHEMMDGSGFPNKVQGAAIGLPGRVLALVNRYENMCNPIRPSTAVTPHEALSLIFAQMKTRFDNVVLAAFIRMMGVYPPGSVVQLSDGRFALVVSVNSARPLKPRVIVHEPAIPKGEALIVDLEHMTTAGIRRSIRPDLLPRASMDYLSPRARICYFFERAAEPVRGETTA